MSVFTISDLHLPLGVNKPMDIFGASWNNYVQRLYDNWTAAVGNDDTVVLPGDFSWAMDLNDTKKDFEFLCSLPGKKILLKGNHDYWWNTVTKVKAFLKSNGFENVTLLQNGYEIADNIALCGSRFWISPDIETLSASDKKVYERELIRCSLSIDKARKDGYDEIIFFTHFPPVVNGEYDKRFHELMRINNIRKVCFGHIHTGAKNGVESVRIDETEYMLVSSNCINFSPVKIF